MFGAKKKPLAPLALLAHGWAGVVFEPHPLREQLRDFGTPFGAAPGLIAVSQLWRPAKLTLGSDARPMVLMDAESMDPRFESWDWTTRGDPALVSRARQEVVGAGLACAEDPRRGLDRSIWASLKPALGENPGAAILPLGVPLGADQVVAQKLGVALRRLREQGIAVAICANALSLAQAPLARPEGPLPGWGSEFLESLAAALRSGAPLPATPEGRSGYEGFFFELFRAALGSEAPGRVSAPLAAWGSLGCLCASGTPRGG